MLCASWVTDLSICACASDDFKGDGDAELERWCLVASTILFALSGRQYPGVCIDVVRPCSRAGMGVQVLSYGPGQGSRPISAGGRPCGCEGGLSCGCYDHASVLLPRSPVRAISEVKVNGVALDPAEYRLVDQRRLIRHSGSWPCCQNLALDDDEAGTWSVAYEFGVPPPPGGAEMAGIYACELSKACQGDEACRLPKRITSIVRENIAMTVIDPYDFIDKGRTGLLEVDTWLKAMNPQGADRAGKILNPDLIQTRRTR